MPGIVSVGGLAILTKVPMKRIAIIWKWQLLVQDEQLVPMPRGARILAVAVQGDAPYIWALVDSTKPRETRKIITLGTGQPTEMSWLPHIGTYQLQGGALVFHVFDGG